MILRALLVGVIVVATVAFVVGTVVERDESGHHDEATEAAPAAVEQSASEEAEHSEAGGERAAEHATEEGTEAAASSAESSHEELRPLGIDIEAWPFVALAAIVSLGLAAAAWLRPRATFILAIAAVLMLAFAALDVREVVHQLDVDESALAVLSAIIAALHIGAAAIAAMMMSRSRHTGSAAPRTTPAQPA